jgi:hypothetical protein
MLSFVDLAKIVSNYALFGFMLILVIIWLPSLAWQIGITFTFCYSAIDLMQDVYPDVVANNPFTLYFAFIVLMTLVVGLLTAYFQRKNHVIRNMFLLLVWSCIVVAFLRLGLFEKSGNGAELTLCGLICSKYFVHIVFALSALYISWFALREIDKYE